MGRRRPDESGSPENQNAERTRSRRSLGTRTTEHAEAQRAPGDRGSLEEFPSGRGHIGRSSPLLGSVTLLQEAGNVRVIGEAPWMLAPAAAIFLVVLGVQLLGRGRAQQTVLSLGARAA